jgi:type I restriction enzyme M protein
MRLIVRNCKRLYAHLLVTTELSKQLDTQGLKLAAPASKAIVNAISVRKDNAVICVDAKGKTEADAELRDSENVPLNDDIGAYFDREVLPYAPDAWIDSSKEKIGYEIPFTRHFYKYIPPRPLEEIDAELNQLVSEIQILLKEIEK